MGGGVSSRTGQSGDGMLARRLGRNRRVRVQWHRAHPARRAGGHRPCRGPANLGTAIRPAAHIDPAGRGSGLRDCPAGLSTPLQPAIFRLAVAVSVRRRRSQRPVFQHRAAGRPVYIRIRFPDRRIAESRAAVPDRARDDGSDGNGHGLARVPHRAQVVRSSYSTDGRALSRGRSSSRAGFALRRARYHRHGIGRRVFSVHGQVLAVGEIEGRPSCRDVRRPGGVGEIQRRPCRGAGVAGRRPSARRRMAVRAIADSAVRHRVRVSPWRHSCLERRTRCSTGAGS